MRRIPITMIVKTAPISNINPVVPNMPTPVFADKSLSDFRRNMAVMRTKTNKTTKSAIIYATKFIKVLKPASVQS